MNIFFTASVPGAKEDDYKVDEELNKLIVEESELQQRDEARQLARQGNNTFNLLLQPSPLSAHLCVSTWMRGLHFCVSSPY